MTTKNTFNIAFFGSSTFVLPILEDISKHQGEKLGELAKKQWCSLKENRKQFIDILPNSILAIDDSVFNQEMINKPIKLAFVVTQPDREIRGKITSNPVADYIRKSNIPLYTPFKINDDLSTFDKIAADLDLSIVASFGQLLSNDVLAASRYGFLNWHPSKLPLYRGSTPMQTCLLNDDPDTALSWIDMNEYMDAGDIYLQLQIDLHKDTVFSELANQMGVLGKETWALVAALRALEGMKSEGQEVDTGMFVAKRQDYGQSTKTSLIHKEDRLVDPDTDTAKYIYNHSRAYVHFPGTWYKSDYFNQEVKLILVKTYISQGEFSHCVSKSKGLGEQDEWYVLNFGKEQKVYLKCKEGYLRVEKICLANGKNIDFAGFVFESKEMVR
jgi:methionyl-tRNA formyltransferase